VSLWFVISTSAQGDAVTAFVGATIVDGTGAAPIENGVVIVSGGRISAVGPASSVTVPAGATRIDLTGRTLLPGFIDVRGHGADAHRPIYLGYGVTSVFLDETIARIPRDRPIDFDFVEGLRKTGACVASGLVRELSLFVYESTPSFFGEPFFLRDADREAVAALSNREFQESVRNNPATPRNRRAFDQVSRNLKQLADARIPIALATESGTTGRFPGSFEHIELELMVRAGLTPMQAIVAATGDAARCIEKAGVIGTIRRGAAADLVAYDRSPLIDIRDTRRIESVWVGGTPVDTTR